VEEPAELVEVEPGADGAPGRLGPADVAGRSPGQDLVLAGPAVVPGQGAQPSGHGAVGEATVAQVAGVLGLSSALEIQAVERSKGTLSRIFG